MDRSAIDRAAYSVPEALAKLGIGRDKLYKLIREGRLPARKLGRRTISTPSCGHFRGWAQKRRREPAFQHQPIEPVPGKEIAGPRWRANPAKGLHMTDITKRGVARNDNRSRILACDSCGKRIEHHAGRRPRFCSRRCRNR